MKFNLIKIFFLFSFFAFAQNEQLALDYFEKGEFEKAVTMLESISSKQPANTYYFERLITCYQQLQQYEKAENAIGDRNKKYRQPVLYVELGYNFQLQKNTSKAEKQYNLALDEVKKEPNYAYQIGNSFEKKVLLDWALKVYEIAQKGNPNLNFDYQIALIEGQKGNVEGMTDKLLQFSFEKPDNTSLVQNYLSRFISEDANGTFTAYLKKALLTKTQKTPDNYWNQFLSWLYVQQKEFGKAFIQERAIYKRNPESFYNIVALAQLAIGDKQNEDAAIILQFVLENTQNVGLQMQAHHFLMQMKIESVNPAEYEVIQNELNLLLKKYGISPYSLNLQVLTAHFDAFYRKQPKEAIQLLNTALKLPLNAREEALVKMELADIMVFDEKFNQAILYYAQVEENLKNDELAHEASMKMAKANYYKNDFDWTFQQVKVLKQSSSLLIANDAIALFLLISDNSKDSTRTALTAYAKADLLLYQKKKEEALSGFLNILEKFKGDSIEDETLLKIGQIFEEKKDYLQALKYYKNIIENHKESVFIDEALFYTAEIFNKKLNDTLQAKPLYEKVIFEHPDSVFYTEAQLEYRKIRGDNAL
ncbi:tetratricopeptide repeat protein [Flavobacterium sp. N2270]|uniref:tetratricopeptide repeat protein n=1 Tax=Flavobacterium sp. N2270 TaxID=2986831 RepID=UPI002224F00B|nr:tetratricopeptide repeat protein [Flavobacterium sp. N2270]